MSSIFRKREEFWLSKVARIVDTLSRKPQLQERLDKRDCRYGFKAVQPQAVCVVIEAEHLYDDARYPETRIENRSLAMLGRLPVRRKGQERKRFRLHQPASIMY